MESKEGVLPITVCANSDCEIPIYPGDSVWKKGKDLFCNSKCLIDSFEDKKRTVLQHGSSTKTT